MNTRPLMISIGLAAVAIVLNPAITGLQVPSPFLTGLYYQFWDIPVIIVSLLLGFKYGALTGLINGVFLFAVFPGPSQPLYAPGNVAAQLSMMVGIFFAQKLTASPNVPEVNVKSRTKTILASTTAAIGVRLPIMLLIMYGILHYIMGIPQVATFALLPVQAVYIVIMVSYTIPIAYAVALLVNKNLKVGNRVI